MSFNPFAAIPSARSNDAEAFIRPGCLYVGTVTGTRSFVSEGAKSLGDTIYKVSIEVLDSTDPDVSAGDSVIQLLRFKPAANLVIHNKVNAGETRKLRSLIEALEGAEVLAAFARELPEGEDPTRDQIRGLQRNISGSMKAQSDALGEKFVSDGFVGVMVGVDGSMSIGKTDGKPDPSKVYANPSWTCDVGSMIERIHVRKAEGKMGLQGARDPGGEQDDSE